MVDRAERLDRDRRRAGIGKVDDGDAVHFLQGDVGEAVVGRDRDVFRLDIGRRALPWSDGETTGPQGGLAAVEALEDRTLLSTFTVNTTADTMDANPGDGIAADADGNTSLRAAVMEANSLAGDDTINLPAGTYTRTCMAIS